MKPNFTFFGWDWHCFDWWCWRASWHDTETTCIVNWFDVAGFSISWEVYWNLASDDSLVFRSLLLSPSYVLTLSVINPILDLNYCGILSKELGALVLIPSKKL